MARVAKGATVCLQGDKSDVQLQITAGCPKRAHLMEVRTDLSSFTSIKVKNKPLIPDNECFIAPVVDILAPAKTTNSAYLLRIPHCLSDDDDKNNVKVRMWFENRHPAQSVIEVPSRDKCTDGVLFYDIDNQFFELHTPHFCKVICTICQTPLHCLDRATSFFFGKFESYEENNGIQHEVEMRPYFCSIPYAKVTDFRQVYFSAHVCQATKCFLPELKLKKTNLQFLGFSHLQCITLLSMVSDKFPESSFFLCCARI